MAPLFFFLGGVPVAFFADRLVQRFAFSYADEIYDDSVRQLPWQRYPMSRYVELLCVLALPPLMALAAWRFQPLEAAAISLFVIALVLCSTVDLLHYRVPNAITYPGAALAIVAAAVLPHGHLTSALIAALLGGFAFLLLALITRGGIGLGDVKLAVMIGAGLGLPAAYQALLAGVIFAGLAILVMWLMGLVSRRQSVPYAPFLALAAVAYTLHSGAAFAPL